MDALSDALIANSSLSYFGIGLILDMHYNRVDGVAAMRLAEALKLNSGLKYLGICANKMSVLTA